jgi:hypothetical protein
MPIALTCDCGARFELDDGLAGKQVPCPGCQQPLETPSAAATVGAPRTSSFALASIVFALVGAFSVAGTVLAVILGCVALMQIRWRAGRVGGSMLAVVGIVAGLALTALTLLLLARPNLIPVDVWIRQRTMASQVDSTGALEVLTRDGSVVLRRPSAAWGRVQRERSEDPAVENLQHSRELLLSHLGRHAFLDVGRLSGEGPLTAFTPYVEADLQPRRPSLMGDDELDAAMDFRPLQAVAGWPRNLDPVERWQVREWYLDKFCGGQKWRFLIRVYKKQSIGGLRGKEPIYVVRGYAPKNRFDAVKDELIAAMDNIFLPK